eukprot:TRINITY_DN46025_c0_g1_i1.p1 TRINITY_DN46025_c0_g1~~TRINITY_DN46025_c0_g1_i1.p1  ORF type:complete len:266 (-),score=27.29 TRINITY_DN46025_c0_g1_i1:77-874(-)
MGTACATDACCSQIDCKNDLICTESTGCATFFPPRLAIGAIEVDFDEHISGYGESYASAGRRRATSSLEEIQQGLGGPSAEVQQDMNPLFDGSTYTGGMRGGKRHGSGSLMSAGTSYDGQWVDDIQHGFGKQMWPDGRLYTGEFSMGMFDGHGSMVWPTDAGGVMIYDGQYKNDRHHGTGTCTWSDGSTYSGQWEHGKKSGRGFLDAGKTSFHGEWFEDQPHGRGKQTLHDGRTFVGKYVHGIFQGEEHVGTRSSEGLITVLSSL